MSPLLQTILENMKEIYMIINNSKNLHFDHELELHTRSKILRGSDYGHELDLLIVLHCLRVSYLMRNGRREMNRYLGPAYYVQHINGRVRASYTMESLSLPNYI